MTKFECLDFRRASGDFGDRKPRYHHEFLHRKKIFKSAEGDLGLLWFYITMLCDWSKKLAPPSQPIRCKTKNNRDPVTCIFPRFKQLACFHFEFSFANDNVNLSSDWSLGLLWF